MNGLAYVWTEWWRRVAYALRVLLWGIPSQPTIVVRRSRNLRRPGIRGRS